MRRLFVWLGWTVVLVGAWCTVAGETRAAERDARSSSAVWFEAPRSEGTTSAADAAAREEVLRWLAEEQTETFRARYPATTPETPTGLPDDYQVVVYGARGGAVRCVIQVRGGRATVDYQTSQGVRRAGRLSAAPLDARVRQLAYAALTRRAGLPEIPGLIVAPHAPLLRIDVASSDARRPWRLLTDARPVAGVANDSSYDGVRGAFHGRLIRTLFDEIDRLPDVIDETARADETLDALRDLVDRVARFGRAAERIREAETAHGVELDRRALDHDGLERALVDARLLGLRAIDARVRDAAPLLEQVGQVARARDVRLVTSRDPARVREALRDAKDALARHVALEAAGALPPPAAADVLLETLRDASFRSRDVIRWLEAAPLDAEHAARLREIARLPATSRERRVELLRLALLKSDDSQARDELHRLASVDETFDFERLEGEAEAALRALVDVALRTERRRAETARLVRAWTSRLVERREPLGKHGWIAAAAGRLGDADDIPRLLELVARSSGEDRVDALFGLAALDGPRAAELARADLVELLAKAPDRPGFRTFDAYLDWFFWQRDLAAATLLLRTLFAESREPGTLDPWRRKIELLDEYVLARDAERRVRCARAYLRQAWLGDFWARDVVRRLEAEGAAPDDVRSLAWLVDRGRLVAD